MAINNTFKILFIFIISCFSFSHPALAGACAVAPDEEYPGTPPAISEINQFKLDGQTLLEENSIITQDTAVFKATLNDSDNNQIKLQIELKEYNQSFNEQDLLESDYVNFGSEVAVTRYGLIDGQYKWRARAVDSYGLVSDWQEFGQTGNVDFEINLSLSYKAANLVKELIYQPYLWGGKGWDFDKSEFVAVNDIKTGYHYYNSNIQSVDIGVGVDCSGLVMWAFNRSFDPLKSRFNNFVKAEGADGQYRYNTTLTTESELKPGDVMFFDNFDKNGNLTRDGFIDHVSMHVGDSGGFDVVSAASPGRGIVRASKDDLEQLPGFVAFKRVVQAPQPAVLATAHSPIDLIVTDPDGFSITPTTTIPSDVEYLREIPGVLYYSEMERGTDGNPIDQVYSYTLKTGDYIIQVLPEPGASSDATYTLDFSAGEQSITLAQDVPVSQIPSQGYGITVSTTGAINSFIPIVIDIKPGSYPDSVNLRSNGVVPAAVLGSVTFDVKQIDLSTIKLENAPIKFKKNGQPMASYEDINRDGFIDVVIHVITESLQLTQTDVEAELNGFLLDGREIKGSDSVRIVP